MVDATKTGLAPEETAKYNAGGKKVGADDSTTMTNEPIYAMGSSYICNFCGKANRLSDLKCLRCGKRRSRGTYASALSREGQGGMSDYAGSGYGGRVNNENIAYATAAGSRIAQNDYEKRVLLQQLESERTARDQMARDVAERENLTRQLEEERRQKEKLEWEQLEQERINRAQLEDEMRAKEHFKWEQEEQARFEQELADRELAAREQFENEKDVIRRNMAREAVLRVIEADKEKDEAILQKEKEADEIIEAERNKVLYAAAQRIISERAGIENAAEERILAERRETERQSQETIDNITRDAARKAVLKVVASEQAAEDRARLERDAISRAASERIFAERRIAENDAYSKYKIEKEAMERAFDERLKAERGARGGWFPPYQQSFGMQQVQPFGIVPYVNPNQPLYQYNTTKQVYRFVPDELVAEGGPMEIEEQPPVEVIEPEVMKKGKKKRFRK